jgi:lysophospholipase L1-like esterase
VSIPDWGRTAFGRDNGRDTVAIARELDAYNAIGADEAARAGTRWIDITAESRACGDDPAMLAADGLHPSAAQYARWTRHILPAARLALADSTG